MIKSLTITVLIFSIFIGSLGNAKAINFKNQTEVSSVSDFSSSFYISDSNENDDENKEEPNSEKRDRFHKRLVALFLGFIFALAYINIFTD